jgi:hypothetical protein
MELLFAILCGLVAAIVIAALLANIGMSTKRARLNLLAPYILAQIDRKAATDQRLQAEIARGNQKEAIKLYQELTGVSSIAAKDIVDFLTENPGISYMPKKVSQPALDDAPGIRDLLDEGREDEAVEVYQKFAGVDEYTARDMVEKIKREMGGE